MNNEQRIEQVFYGVDFFRKKKCCRQAKSSKVFLQKKLSAGWLNLRNREEEFVPFFSKNSRFNIANFSSRTENPRLSAEAFLIVT